MVKFDHQREAEALLEWMRENDVVQAQLPNGMMLVAGGDLIVADDEDEEREGDVVFQFERPIGSDDPYQDPDLYPDGLVPSLKDETDDE